METRTLQRRRANAAILAAACIELAFLFTSCAGGGSTAAIPVSTPGVSISNASVTFSNQSVGTTSAAQTVTLNNTGNASLSIISLAVTGANAGDFAQSNTCVSPLGAGANCTISVTFTPTASGTRTASVSITDNASGSPQAVSLTGTGTAPVVSLSAASLTFASQPAITTSSPQTVTLSNTGNATLSITSIAVTGTNASDFAQANTCGSTVAAGGNCTIAVLFTPSATGTRTASLSISDNASGSPQTVPLSGAGTHDVILSWPASTTPEILGYNVYRGTSSGGESSTAQNCIPITPTSCADANVTAGTKHYYVVTAVASDGITQSAASNEASATVPSP